VLITHQQFHCCLSDTCECESVSFLSFSSVGDEFSCVRASFPSVPPLQKALSKISQNHRRSFY